ncbi:sulfate adenylyltransferase subunit CysD [Niveibacterium umoris]|nr:sulfate adenylyltransferase subunit CysD [Niveibacterium umoris]
MGLLPAALSPEVLRDEHNRPLNRLVLQWALDRARRRRERVIFLQSHPLPDGTPCLHANDARGGRFWFPVNGGVTADAIDLALRALELRLGNAIAVFPHGPVTATLRLPLAHTEPLMAYLPDFDIAVGQRPKSEDLPPDLKRLEDEGIHLIRELLASGGQPALLHSAGKESAVLLHLLRKACHPAPPATPLLHIGSPLAQPEASLFLERVAMRFGVALQTYRPPATDALAFRPRLFGTSRHGTPETIESLRLALEHFGFDVLLDGCRRDELSTRAGLPVVSMLTRELQPVATGQTRALWELYNTLRNGGELLRASPLSNWTETDIWRYIGIERIPVMPLYFAKPRPVVKRGTALLLIDRDDFPLLPAEQIEVRSVRAVTLGGLPQAGLIESQARSIPEILLELPVMSSPALTWPARPVIDQFHNEGIAR